jgi:two-component system NtrC family response regulator
LVDTREPTDTVRTLKEAREAVEKDLILQALARHQGNVTRTAAELGVSRPTLHDLLTKLGLRR